MVWTATHGSSKKDGTSAVTLSEVAVNDSNKDLIFSSNVAVGQYLEVLSIRIEMTCTATVGTRTMVVELLSATDDILRTIVLDANTLTASQSRIWELAPDNDPAVTTPQYVRLAGKLLLHGEQKLSIRDSAAIDAAADDLVLHVHGLTR